MTNYNTALQLSTAFHIISMVFVFVSLILGCMTIRTHRITRAFAYSVDSLSTYIFSILVQLFDLALRADVRDFSVITYTITPLSILSALFAVIVIIFNIIGVCKAKKL